MRSVETIEPMPQPEASSASGGKAPHGSVPQQPLPVDVGRLLEEFLAYASELERDLQTHGELHAGLDAMRSCCHAPPHGGSCRDSLTTIPAASLPARRQPRRAERRHAVSSRLGSCSKLGVFGRHPQQPLWRRAEAAQPACRPTNRRAPEGHGLCIRVAAVDLTRQKMRRRRWLADW